MKKEHDKVLPSLRRKAFTRKILHNHSLHKAHNTESATNTRQTKITPTATTTTMRTSSPTMKLPHPLLLGRNTRSLTATVLMLVVSTIFLLQSLPTAHAEPAHYELTKRQISDFRRDGFIVVRGMLEGEILDDAVNAAHKIQKSQGWAQRMIHKLFPLYSNLSFQTHRKHKAFKKVAFDSAAPTIAAKLMGLDQEHKGGKSRTLRLLKEAIMGFSRGDLGCGWHVDDKTFWPCEDSHKDSDNHGTILRGQPRDAGINVWITLSPVTAEEGGGLAVAPGSHNLSGKGRVGRIVQRARRAIASGGQQTTCALARLDPESHAYMEEIKCVYDLQPGDAIVHDRYLFHKPDAFKKGNDDEMVVKQRVSIRYMPSDATYFGNENGLDRAVVHKNLQTGDPLWKAGEYFPQAWPSQLEDEAKASPQQDANMLGTSTLIEVGMKKISMKISSVKKTLVG